MPREVRSSVVRQHKTHACHDDGCWLGFFVSRFVCVSGFALHLVVFSVFFELECMSSWWDLVRYWCLLSNLSQPSLSLNAYIFVVGFGLLSLNAFLHGGILFVFWCLLSDFPQTSLSLNACLPGEIWFVLVGVVQWRLTT